MSKKITIRSFEELVEFIKETEMSSEQLCSFLAQTIHVYAWKGDTKEKIISDLEAFWAEWGSSVEKPLFIDSEMDRI